MARRRPVLRTRPNFARALATFAALSALLVACAVEHESTRPPSTGEPPDELRALPNGGMTRTVFSDDAGRFVRMSVSIDTTFKRVLVRWIAQAGSGAASSVRFTTHAVAFHPTAVDLSFEDPEAFYVVGSDASGEVLQRWCVGPIEDLTASGTPLETSFTPPEFQRETLPIDASIRDVCSLTVNPHRPGGGGEEVWVFEWESRNVYAIDGVDGHKSLRIASTIAAPYRSIHMMRHSIYGSICFLNRCPFFISASDWIRCRVPDPDFLVTYDQDLDGVIDGTWTIPWSSQTSHVLYSTGEFVHD
jgi:hypothetical protein